VSSVGSFFSYGDSNPKPSCSFSRTDVTVSSTKTYRCTLMSFTSFISTVLLQRVSALRVPSSGITIGTGPPISREVYSQGMATREMKRERNFYKRFSTLFAFSLRRAGNWQIAARRVLTTKHLLTCLSQTVYSAACRRDTSLCRWRSGNC